MIGAAGIANRQVRHAEAAERLHPLPEDRRDRIVALQVDPANRPGSVVDVEVAGELRVIRFELERTKVCSASAAASAELIRRRCAGNRLTGSSGSRRCRTRELGTRTKMS